MVRIFSFFYFLFICFSIQAQTLELIDSSNPEAWGAKTTTNITDMALVVDPPTSSGTSSSDPTSIYLPFSNAVNEDYTAMAHPTELILGGPNGTDWIGVLRVRFKVSNPTTST